MSTKGRTDDLRQKRCKPCEGDAEPMSFVNAVAWIANREDHHPDLQVGYGSCTVTLSTHSIGGLSENDFISAAKVNALIED